MVFLEMPRQRVRSEISSALVLDMIYTSYILHSMDTKVIFNIDRKLKSAAQKKADAQGLTLSAMLNLATRAYVNGGITIDVIGEDIARARRGKSIPAAEVYRRLGLKK